MRSDHFVPSQISIRSRSATRSLRFLMQGAVTSLAIFAITRYVNLDALRAIFSSIRPIPFLGAITLVGVTFMIGAVRWWILLHAGGCKLSLWGVLRIVLIGQFYNAILVGAMGGDAVKAYCAYRHSWARRHWAIVSVLLDRVTGFLVVSTVALMAVALIFTGDVRFASVSKTLIWLVLMLYGGLMMIWVSIRTLRAKRVPFLITRSSKWGRRAIRLMIALSRMTLITSDLLICLGLSILLYFIVFLAAFLVAKSISISLSFLEIAVSVSLVTVITSLPISLGGHGIRELSFGVLFKYLGIGIGSSILPIGPADIAVSYSLMFFATYFFWSIVGYFLHSFTVLRGSGTGPC